MGKGVELREAATVFQGWRHKPGVVTLSATGPRQAISPLSDLLPFILCFFFKKPGLMDLLCRYVSFPVQ